MIFKYLNKLRYKRRRQRLKEKRNNLSGLTVIGISGSCGKTSTTKFLSAILSSSASTYTGIDGNVAKWTLKNIAKLNNNHKFFIQEVAANTKGSVKENVDILCPEVGIITTIGLDHYKEFRSLDGVAAEKQVLITQLPSSGIAILNFDDPYVLAMSKHARCDVFTYGMAEEADLRAVDIKSNWPDTLSFTVCFKGEKTRVETKLFGDILLTSILAAIGGGLCCGIRLEQCAAALKNIESYSRRLTIHPTSAGPVFINDAFKAPHWGVEKVVSLLKDCIAPRKTLVVGAFSDTPGTDSSKYRDIAMVALNFCDRVIFVGEKASYLQKRIDDNNKERLLVFKELKEVYDFLKNTALQDELILLKSTKRKHLERLIYIDRNMACWQENCFSNRACENCEKSGLL